MKHKELLTKIKEKGGVKLVTVQLENAMDIFKIDEQFQDDFLFLKMVKEGMQNGGVVNIRQFIGEEQYLIASVLLQHNTYVPMNALDTKEAYSYDAETGESLEEEKGVTFVTLNELQTEVDFSVPSGIELKILHIEGSTEVSYDEEETEWQTSFQLHFIYERNSYQTTVYFGVPDTKDDELITTISMEFEDRFLEETTQNQVKCVQDLLEEWIDLSHVDEEYLSPLYQSFYDKYGFHHPDEDIEQLN